MKEKKNFIVLRRENYFVLGQSFLGPTKIFRGINAQISTSKSLRVVSSGQVVA